MPFPARLLPFVNHPYFVVFLATEQQEIVGEAHQQRVNQKPVVSGVVERVCQSTKEGIQLANPFCRASHPAGKGSRLSA